MLILSLLGWPCLHGLGRLYRWRLISDQSVLIDSLWFLFALTAAVDFAFFGGWLFLDAFAKLWRHAGHIRLIAGPDLATSTGEPHEFIDFLSGRLGRRFISGPETPARRLSEMETAPRFRRTLSSCRFLLPRGYLQDGADALVA